MHFYKRFCRGLRAAGFMVFASVVVQALGAGVEPVRSLALKEKPALIATLKDLVSIESGSTDLEGLDKLARLLVGRLHALGGTVEVIEPGAAVYRMHDTPEKIGRMVRATFSGTGSKKILLLAHMDTVYPRGMLAQQPFRIEGNRAYGLGIADDKQGMAVILHTLAILQALRFREYGTLTVFMNGDEEIGSVRIHPNLYQRGAAYRHADQGEGGRCGVHTVSRLQRVNDGNALNWDTDAFGVGPASGSSMSGPVPASTISSTRLTSCVSWCCGGSATS